MYQTQEHTDHLLDSLKAIKQAFKSISKEKMDAIIHKIDALPSIGPTIYQYVHEFEGSYENIANRNTVVSQCPYIETASVQVINQLTFNVSDVKTHYPIYWSWDEISNLTKEYNYLNYARSDWKIVSDDSFWHILWEDHEDTLLGISEKSSTTDSKIGGFLFKFVA